MLNNVRALFLIISTLIVFLFGAPAYGLRDYISDTTKPIQGFRPYFPSIAPYVYLKESTEIPYLAKDNNGVKIRLKVGDRLSLPMINSSENYNEYFFWADKDGEEATSDKANMPSIKSSVKWYRVKYGEIDIKPGINAVLLDNDRHSNDSTDPSYEITEQDVGYQIGLSIVPSSILGVPKLGTPLEIPNIAYLGRQVSANTPNIPPRTSDIDRDNPSHQHPDILDRPVTMENEFIVKVKDITDINHPIDINENSFIFVTHKYKAYIEQYNADTDTYMDVTEKYTPFLAWSIYKETIKGERILLYEYMTSNGLIKNIPTDEELLSQFDPQITPYIYDALDNLAIKSRFVEGNNGVLQLQRTNRDALPKTQMTEPHFSEQGLKIKVHLLIR